MKTREVTSFAWHECVERVRALRARGPLAWSRERRALLLDQDDGTRLSLHPPLALLPGGDLVGELLDRWLEDFPKELGLEFLVLVQAGASALGLWEDDELVRHKVIKKYVVRGRGRAQPQHLRTRGKSRYGSRLRLSNARAQLEETNGKLREWWEAFGEPRRILVSCPVRTWPELLGSDPAPPFGRDDPRLGRVGLDVKVPSFEELLRVRYALYTGRLAKSARD